MFEDKKLWFPARLREERVSSLPPKVTASDIGNVFCPESRTEEGFDFALVVAEKDKTTAFVLLCFVKHLEASLPGVDDNFNEGRYAVLGKEALLRWMHPIFHRLLFFAGDENC